MDCAGLEKMIAAAKKKMEEAASQLSFMEAAKYRDEMNTLKDILAKK